MEEYRYLVCTRCFTYNQASYILDALHGFEIQETNFPVVYTIVDDASNDGEDKVLKEWAKNNLLLNEEGVAVNVIMPYGHKLFGRHNKKTNAFFAFIILNENHYKKGKTKIPYIAEWRDTSKYSALCEGDDYWIDPRKIQKQFEIMEHNPDVSMVHTDCQMLYQDTGEILPSGNAPMAEVLAIEDEHVVIDNILNGKYKVRPPSVFYRNDSYSKYLSSSDPFLRSAYFLMGDIQQWIGLIQQGKILYIPEAQVVYRVSGGSTSRPKKYYDSIRFQLSSKELRIYYNQHYGYLEKEIVGIKEDYKHLLRIYREHDPSFVGLFTVESLYDCKLQHLWFRLHNKWWYIKHNLNSLLTRIRGKKN